MHCTKSLLKNIVLGHRLAGDLIALGSKPGAPKSALRHEQLEDSKKTGGSSAPGVPPAKKHKPTPSSGDNTGGLFSNPIMVSQVSTSSPGSMSKSNTGVGSKVMSQQSGQSGSSGTQMIEGNPGGTHALTHTHSHACMHTHTHTLLQYAQANFSQP